jgi:CheY-like chemotaxis protein
MKPEALILTGDLELSQAIRTAVERFGIATGSGAKGGDVLEELQRNKFDLVVVDCSNIEQGCAALREIRLSPTHRSAVSIAIIGEDGSREQVSEAGADFIVSHANYPVEIATTLRSAYGLILRERGRYSRFPLVAEVDVRCSAFSTHAWILNVSQGGVCIRGIDEPLSGSLQMRFAFEDGGSLVELTGNIVWQRDGLTGVQFTSMTKADRAELENWLSRQFEIQTLVRPPMPSSRMTPHVVEPAPSRTEPRTPAVPIPGGLHPIVTAIIRGGPVRARCSGCQADIPLGPNIGDSIEQERKLRDAFTRHVQEKHAAEFKG